MPAAMSSLTQYTDLYRQTAAKIDANSAPVLNALRPAALEALDRAGRLPLPSDEGFEKTSIEEMYAPDFGLNPDRLPIEADIAATFRCDVPNLSTLLALVVNDRFVPTSTLIKNLPEGVTVCSLREAALNHPDLVAKYYGRLAPLDVPGVALNTLLCQEGVFIHVGAGVRLHKPLQLVNIFSARFPFMAPRRILLVAEDGAEVQLLKCDHTQTPGVKYLSSEVVEIYAGAGARIGWYDLEESSAETARYSQFYLRQERDSHFDSCTATLCNGSTRNEYNIDVVGNGCHTLLAGMAIGTGSQHVDNNSQLTHRSEHSSSRQLFKYVLDDRATGAFEGSIEVAHGARFTEAYQSNRNILASRDARMHTKPQLLIYNDDVKCSHGATTGQLDAEALFYMQTRGIPMKEARRMLMQAFLVDVIDAISLEQLRDRLRHMVENRFSGDHTTCTTCRNKPASKI